jgi:hypothetical protein
MDEELGADEDAVKAEEGDIEKVRALGDFSSVDIVGLEEKK